MPMFMKVLACSTIQYCDESFIGAEVICDFVGGFSGREFVFTKCPVTAGKLTHHFPRPRRKDVLLHPVSECSCLFSC